MSATARLPEFFMHQCMCQGVTAAKHQHVSPCSPVQPAPTTTTKEKPQAEAQPQSPHAQKKHILSQKEIQNQVQPYLPRPQILEMARLVRCLAEARSNLWSYAVSFPKTDIQVRFLYTCRYVPPLCQHHKTFHSQQLVWQRAIEKWK